MTRPHELQVVAAAPDQASILSNLIELYAHDFSEFHNIQIGDDGRFGYPSLPLYWSDPDRHAFLVKLNGKWAGFALVKRGSNLSGNADVSDMAEFFILRGYRRHKIGTQAAHEIWNRFPGAWEVRVMQANVSAQHFWASAISKFTGEPIQPARLENARGCWILFSFESNESNSNQSA